MSSVPPTSAAAAAASAAATAHPLLHPRGPLCGKRSHGSAGRSESNGTHRVRKRVAAITPTTDNTGIHLAQGRSSGDPLTAHTGRTMCSSARTRCKWSARWTRRRCTGLCRLPAREKRRRLREAAQRTSVRIMPCHRSTLRTPLKGLRHWQETHRRSPSVPRVRATGSGLCAPDGGHFGQHACAELNATASWPRR